MVAREKQFVVRNRTYMIRPAKERDAKQLSELRLQIDGETENMDREQGEAYIDESGFKKIIQVDTTSPCNLFLVAEVDGRIVGFSRCEGSMLKRFSHKVEFGVCVLKEFWDYRMGRNLLQHSVQWADENGITKMSLSVLETNEKAIQLYKNYGFDVEGILINDKILADGNYYNTIVMGRINENSLIRSN